jgi:hypothetical protein
MVTSCQSEDPPVGRVTLRDREWRRAVGTELDEDGHGFEKHQARVAGSRVREPRWIQQIGHGRP